MSKKSRKNSTKARSRKAGKRAADRFQLWWALVAVVVLVGGGIYYMNRINSPAETGNSALPLEISVDEAYQKYQEGVFVLDVRTPEEWNEYHAPNTTLIPLDELSDRVDELPRGQEIVVICRSGNRSQTGRDILLDAGFAQVTSSAGGLQAWASAGYPVVSGP